MRLRRFVIVTVWVARSADLRDDSFMILQAPLDSIVLMITRPNALPPLIHGHFHLDRV